MSVPRDPDLRAEAAALIHAGARFVVIGGFAVIAHEYVRATEAVDLLIPADAANDGALDGALARLDGLWDDEQPFHAGELVGREHARFQRPSASSTSCGKDCRRSTLTRLLRAPSPPTLVTACFFSLGWRVSWRSSACQDVRGIATTCSS